MDWRTAPVEASSPGDGSPQRRRGSVFDPTLQKWVSDGLGHARSKHVHTEYGEYFDPIQKVWKYPTPGAVNCAPHAKPQDDPLGAGSRLGAGVREAFGVYNPITGVWTRPPTATRARENERRDAEIGLQRMGGHEHAPTLSFDPLSVTHRAIAPTQISERPRTAIADRATGKGASAAASFAAQTGSFDVIRGEWRVAPGDARFQDRVELYQDTHPKGYAPPPVPEVYDPIKNQWIGEPPADAGSDGGARLTLAPADAFSPTLRNSPAQRPASSQGGFYGSSGGGAASLRSFSRSGGGGLPFR